MNNTDNISCTAAETIHNIHGKQIKIVSLTPDITMSAEQKSRISQELYSVFGKYSENSDVTA